MNEETDLKVDESAYTEFRLRYGLASNQTFATDDFLFCIVSVGVN